MYFHSEEEIKTEFDLFFKFKNSEFVSLGINLLIEYLQKVINSINDYSMESNLFKITSEL